MSYNEFVIFGRSNPTPRQQSLVHHQGCVRIVVGRFVAK
jgi:hypothetical protein